MQGSFTEDKNRRDGTTPPTTTSTRSSFNLDEAALFVAGAVPDTGFSYFAHYELYQDGSNFLEQAVWRITGGPRQQQLLRQGRRDAHAGGWGTRAAMFYNLFSGSRPTR